MSAIFTLSDKTEAANFNAGMTGATPDQWDTPGVFTNALPIKATLESGAAKILYSAAGAIAEPGETPSVLDLFAPAVRQVQGEALDIARRVKPDPKTTGWVGQEVFALGDIGYRAAAAAVASRNPLAAAALVGKTTYDFQQAENKGEFDPATAKHISMLQAGADALSVMLPVSFGKTLAQKLIGGGVLNTVVGGAERGLIEHTLNENGYPEQAKGYSILDKANVAADFIMGMFFGGVSHFLHGESVSMGKIAGESYIKTPEFIKRFEGSKVVDEGGMPIRVMHGGAAVEKLQGGITGNEGIYFTDNSFASNAFADRAQKETGSSATHLAYLDIKNPKIIEDISFWKKFRDRNKPILRTESAARRRESSFLPKEKIDQLKAQGYDGIINNASHEYIVFSQDQIIPAFSDAARVGEKKPAPEGQQHLEDAVMPSDVDSAVAAKVWHNNEIDQAPGLPVDTASRNAHAEALDTAMAQIIDNKPVEVSELVKDAQFVANPIHEETRAEVQKIIEENKPLAEPAKAKEKKVVGKPQDSLAQALAVLRGEAKADKVPLPDSLAQFVAKQGGVKDIGGDLAFMGANEFHKDRGGKAKPFQRKVINNENGRNLDDMALRAWEAGYFPGHQERPSINEFLNAMEGDIRGTQPVRRVEDMAAHTEKNSLNDYIANLEETLHGAGVDIMKMSDAEVASALDEHINPKGLADALAAEQAKLLIDNPDLIIENDEGKSIRADAALRDADAGIKEAENEASLFETAIDCFLRGGE